MNAPSLACMVYVYGISVATLTVSNRNSLYNVCVLSSASLNEFMKKLDLLSTYTYTCVHKFLLFRTLPHYFVIAAPISSSMHTLIFEQYHTIEILTLASRLVTHLELWMSNIETNKKISCLNNSNNPVPLSQSFKGVLRAF